MAADGDVTYEIRADDSNLDRDLDRARQRVENSARRSGQNREDIDRRSADNRRDIDEDLTDHHQGENDRRDQSDEESGQHQEETAKKTGEKLKSIASGTAKAIGAGMLAAGSAAVAIGGMAVKSATDMDQAMNQFLASTGKGADEVRRYQNILEDIYTNNYGESFEDIAGAMAEVRTQVGLVVDSWDDEGLQEFTESAFALRDTFGYEIPESVRAANTMMEQFGVDGTDAMSLIAAGAQNGLDYSGELIDSINEYSVQFAKLGFSADDMFHIFQKGAENGAWNLDKIGDAVKEFSIRAIDGSDSTIEGFTKIGLKADDMAAKFAAGGDTARAAFQETVEALSSMQDPLEQNIAGTDLFGTMWEDLGPDAVAALADISNEAYDTADAMNTLKDVKYDDLGSMLEGLKRSAEMLLIPLGEQLIPVLTELIEAILPMIQEALPPIMEAVGQVIEQLMPVIEEIFPVLLDLFESLMPPLMNLINAILPVLVSLFQELAPPIMEIVSAILPVLVELIHALLPIFQELVAALMPVIQCFLELLTPILQLIAEALVPLMEACTPLIKMFIDQMIPGITMLTEAFTAAFSGILEAATSSISSLTDVLKSIIDFMKNVFAGDWKAAWENVKDIFAGIADALGTIFKAPINYMIDQINSFLDGLGKIEIPEWVPIIGGKGFNIPKIPRLKTGIDFVPGDYYPAYLDYGERVLTQQENIRFSALGGLAGMEAALSQGHYNGEQKIVLGKGCIVVQAEIDGKTAAQAMAPHMDTELGTVKETGGRQK